VSDTATRRVVAVVASVVGLALIAVGFVYRLPKRLTRSAAGFDRRIEATITRHFLAVLEAATP
jgi:hypothetical protein